MSSNQVQFRLENCFRRGVVERGRTELSKRVQKKESLSFDEQERCLSTLSSTSSPTETHLASQVELERRAVYRRRVGKEKDQRSNVKSLQASAPLPTRLFELAQPHILAHSSMVPTGYRLQLLRLSSRSTFPSLPPSSLALADSVIVLVALACSEER